MKIKLILISIFALGLNSAYSQNAQKALQEIWQEKTEWRQKAYEQNNNTGHTTDNLRSATDSNVIVSATADIQSEVHAAVNPTDSSNIVVSSNFVSTASLFPSQTNYIYYTKDFGQTWQQSSFLTAPDVSPSYVLGGGDPNFAFTDSGKAYFSWINLYSDATFSNTFFNLYWASSLDGGNTWQRNPTNDIIGSAPSSITGSGGAFDKEWLAVDKNPASPYYGNLYCSFFEVNATTNAFFMGVRKKTPSGTFDTVSAQVNTNTYYMTQFSSIAVDHAGNVHVTFFGSLDSLTYSLYHAVSNDGGNTFQPETKISDVSLARFTQGQATGGIVGIDSTRLYPSSYVAADNTSGPHSNNLYMVWTANGISGPLNSGYDVYISTSSNGGATWSAARILNDNTSNLSSDQYYPNITVSPTGRVVVTWWDRRDDSLNLKSNIYFTYSDDGGQTFVPDQKVTSLFTDFSTVGLMNGGFGIGEYNAVLATANYVIPVWADGRSNTGQLNLYAAFINTTQGANAGLQNISTINGPLTIDGLYPNPAKNALTLSYESSEAGKMQLAIYDEAGKLVMPLVDQQITAAKGSIPLDITDLAAGTYLLKVTLNGTMNVRQFVKVSNGTW